MYFIYILTNTKKTVLYTGVTNNLVRRVYEHFNDRGTRYHFSTRYACFNLVYFEEHTSIYDAIARESQIKKWGRAKKIELIRSCNPEFTFLNNLIFDKWPPDEK